MVTSMEIAAKNASSLKNKTENDQKINKKNDNNKETSKNKNGQGNTDNTTDDKAQNAETITIENPHGLCGACGYDQEGDKSYKNYCPMCHKTGTLIIHQSKSNSGKPTKDSEISCRGSGGCGADFCGKCGDELNGTHRSKLVPADGQIGDSSESTSGSGGGAAIKDKTFEDCIRRICAATDSVFIVENNAAVLFPYTDWMALTLQKDRETISKDNIDPDVFEIEYNTTGTYNKVTATWGKTTDTAKEGKTKTKKDGKFTTKEKNNKDGTAEMSKQYDSLIEQFGELEKHVDLQVKDRNTVEFILNALLIQYIREFNSSYKVRSLNKTKFVGGTFYAVDNLNTDKLDILYLNGYTIRTQKDEPLYIDLEFKYGPSAVEDINDYQEYSGSGGGSSSDAGSVNASDILGIGRELAKYKYQTGCSTYECMKKKGYGECYAMSDALFTELSKKGYTVKIIQYPSSHSSSGTHRTVQYKDGTEWKDFPYRECGFDKMFNDFKHSKSSEKIIKTNEGSASGGASESDDNKNDNSSKKSSKGSDTK